MTCSDAADGVLLTGSPSNVHPSHYAEDVLDESLPLDPERDAWTLPIVPKALGLGMPLFAICRGFQEANVALGGTLFQAVHQVEGFRDHRDRDEDPIEVQYGIAHDVVDRARRRARRPDRQAVDRRQLPARAGHQPPRPGLRVEARAPDGLIEAFSVAVARRASRWPCNGIRNGTRRAIRCRARCCSAFGDAARSYRRHAHVRASGRFV